MEKKKIEGMTWKREAGSTEAVFWGHRMLCPLEAQPAWGSKVERVVYPLGVEFQCVFGENDFLKGSGSARRAGR